jgi:hypothetical protein
MPTPSGPEPFSHGPARRFPVFDIAYLALAIVLFALAALLVRGSERL